MTQLWEGKDWFDDRRLKNVFLANAQDIDHFKAYGFNLF